MIVSIRMRSYILTKLERDLLKDYLKDGITSDAFWVLLNRINKNYAILCNDIEIIQTVIGKREFV